MGRTWKSEHDAADVRQGATAQSGGAESWKSERSDLVGLHRWTPRQIVLAVALELIGAIVVLTLAFAIHANPRVQFPGDVGLIVFVQRALQPVAGFVNLASDANWPMPAGVTVFAVTILLVMLRRYLAAVATLVAGFLADFTAFFLLNDWVKRPRPHDVSIHAVANIGVGSFPSGHVAHVTAFYGFLFYLAWHESRAHPNWTPWLRIVQVICAYFILFIGPSRLLEGEHWPTDVLASYIIGAMMLVLAIAFYHWLMWAWPHRHGLLARLRQEPEQPAQATPKA